MREIASITQRIYRCLLLFFSVLISPPQIDRTPFCHSGFSERTRSAVVHGLYDVLLSQRAAISPNCGTKEGNLWLCRIPWCFQSKVSFTARRENRKQQSNAGDFGRCCVIRNQCFINPCTHLFSRSICWRQNFFYLGPFSPENLRCLCDRNVVTCGFPSIAEAEGYCVERASCGICFSCSWNQRIGCFCPLG